MMSSSQLRHSVPFIEFLRANGSEFFGYQDVTTVVYPILTTDGRDFNVEEINGNGNYTQKKEINSFYFYKVSFSCCLVRKIFYLIEFIIYCPH